MKPSLQVKSRSIGFTCGALMIVKHSVIVLVNITGICLPLFFFIKKFALLALLDVFRRIDVIVARRIDIEL